MNSWDEDEEAAKNHHQPTIHPPTCDAPDAARMRPSSNGAPRGVLRFTNWTCSEGWWSGASRGGLGMGTEDTVDDWNPANQLRLVVYPCLYMFIPWFIGFHTSQLFARFQPSTWQVFFLELTLPETNSKFAPENRLSQKERIVFQPSIFRCELLILGMVPSWRSTNVTWIKGTHFKRKDFVFQGSHFSRDIR